MSAVADEADRIRCPGGTIFGCPGGALITRNENAWTLLARIAELEAEHRCEVDALERRIRDLETENGELAEDANGAAHLRAENERLRADCERGRELLREMSTHHDRHHEWDEIADGVIDAAHTLCVEVVRSVSAESMTPELRAALGTYTRLAMASEGEGPALEKAMSRVTIPRDDDGNATPSWQRYEPGSPSAIVVCPNGHNCAIGVPGTTKHTIAADGEVNPSVVCPECDFHEFVILDGWDAG